MDWLTGYAAEWSVSIVDRETWADAAELQGVTNVSISRDCTSDVPLLETGTMRLDSSATFGGEWCRVYMKSGGERIAVATLLFEQATSRVDFGTADIESRGRSVLQPLEDRKMGIGSYLPAGFDGAAFVGRLVRECTPAPVEVDGGFTLVNDLVFNIGASYLQAAWTVLDAAGWCMQIDGDGTIHVRNRPSGPSLELDAAHSALLVPGVDDDLSLVDVPNRYIAIDGANRAEAVNDSPDSIASHAVRGRWVDMVDTSPKPVDGESLQMYAERRLTEESTVLRTFKYTREYWPGVVPFSLVRATLPDSGLEGDLRVMSQEITCGNGMTVSENAGMEVRL